MTKKLSELTIEIVQQCANKCLFCSSLSGRDARKIIALRDIISVGKQAKELGLVDICVSGGEPLLHPNLENVVSELIGLGLKVTLYTTGIKLDSDQNAVAFKEWNCFDPNNVKLIFGLQSTDSTIHDRIAGNAGAYEKSITSILEAINHGFPVEVHIVPNKINLMGIEKTVEDLISLGVKKVSFLRLVAQGYARKNKDLLVLSQSENDLLKQMLQRVQDKHIRNENIRLGIPFSGMVDRPRTCNAGDSKLIIRYDGKVLPCEAFKDECFNSYCMGDITKDSLSSMLSNARSNSSLKVLKSQLTFSETCPAQLLYC